MRRPGGVIAVLFLFVVGAFAGGYSYRAALEAQGNPLGTLLHEFRPAVLFAAGRGMVCADTLDIPELDSFLAGEAETFDASLLPDKIEGMHLLANPVNAFPLTHWLLIYSVGWCWRICGISHEALWFLCALFYAFSAVALYCLFRLGMGRPLSVAGTMFMLFAPPFLAIAPMLRDFSKAPFLLFFMAIAGNMVRRRSPSRHLLKYGLLLGVVMGIGYGFRQDILICLPVALFVVLVAPLQEGYRPLHRAGAMVFMGCMFAVLASPTLIGVHADSGSVSTHTLFQGLSRRAEQQMGFGDACYELLLRPDDTETHAVVNAHARKREITGKMDLYLSPAYGHAGRRIFLEWARTFPADLFARGLSSIDATTRLFSLAVAYYAYEPLADTALAGLLSPCYETYHRYIEPFSLLFFALALFVISLHTMGLAVTAMLLMGWFMAYPNLLFDVRHAFYLAFVTPWTVLFLVQHARRGISEILSGKDGVRLALKRAALRSGLLFLVLLAGVLGMLMILRLVQVRHVSALMSTYEHALLEPVDTVAEVEEFHTLIRPEKPLPGLSESWNLPVGDAAVEYLALEFAPSEYPVSVTMAYQPDRGADFTRQLLVPATPEEYGRRLYFVPVYELANYMPVEFSLLKHRFSNTPLANLLAHHWGTNRFMGIRLHQADASLLTGVYRVADRSPFPWLLYLQKTKNAPSSGRYKQMRLEKDIRVIPAEIGLLMGGDIGKAVARYFDLLNRFPGHRRFAERIKSLVAEMTDIEARARALFRLGRHVPEQAGVIARDIAAEGDILRESNALESAEEKYRRALILAPYDRGHQVKLADVLLARGQMTAARDNYEAVLRAAPESPYSAVQFDAACIMLKDEDTPLPFWRELHEAYPNAAVPALHLGLALERRSELEEARALYKQVEEQHPENTEATLRYGILAAMLEGYAKGRAMMDNAVAKAPELKPELVAGLTRIAAHYTDSGSHTFAEAIYREIIELAPDDGWHQVRYAETLLAQENYDKAKEVFLKILERSPESPYSAFKLDEIYESTNDLEGRLTTWDALHEMHPDAFVPLLHLGKALERLERPSEALEQYRTLHAAHPEQPEAALRLGTLMAQTDDYASGRLLMDKAVAEDQNLTSLFFTKLAEIAEHVFCLNIAEQAESLYRELVGYAPEEPFYALRLSESLFLQERYREALEICRLLIGAVPEYVEGALLLDAIYAKLGDPDDRLADWRALCDTQPTSILPHLHLGMAYESAGQLEEALFVYAAASRRAPDNAALQLRYGTLVALLEDYDKGRAIMSQALANAPELQQDMADGLARVADRMKDHNQYESAESLYREAIAMSPEDYWHQVRLGELYLVCERFDDAQKIFTEILLVRPESPHTAALLDQLYSAEEKKKKRLELWRDISNKHSDAATPRYYLGLACEANGLGEEALAAYEEALRIKPDYPEVQEAMVRLSPKTE